MADATNVKNLIVNAGGSSYQINVSDIYTEMGVSEERFAELLSRDFYCPVLPTAPTEQTLTYVDTDGSVNHFAVGQECRVPDIEKKEYQIYKFLGTYQGSAVWIRLEEYDPMHLTYEEQWDHTKVPYKSGMMLKFNQEFFVSLKETSLPPVDLVYMDEGVIAKVDDHTYATVGSYDAVGNKEDWKKIPFDELRLVSRKGTLDGADADVRELSGDDVYRFEPDLYIDLVKGVLKGKKVDLKLPKKNVTDALGYVPVSPTQLASRIDQLFDEKALDMLQGSDVLAIESKGKKATVTVDILRDYAFWENHDLSRYDIYGNPIKQTTANCYVVSKTGYYEFPLVYGNALKDGKDNKAAYTNNGGANSMDFVNHLDKQITSPYIEQNEGCVPVSAELSLCDADGVISNIAVVQRPDCKHICFRVNSVPKTGTNGVISVLDKYGVVMWSWHIWVWEDDLTPVTITNATNVSYDILPVNLASKWDEDSKTHIKNWFYQWGRHIPMLSPSAYNSHATATNYGKRTLNYTVKAASYGVGLKNPWNFYYSTGDPQNWFGDIGYYNLWDAACSNSGLSDNNVIKTIYDPSPIGFKMPNGKTFSGFSTSNIAGTYNYGYCFKRNAQDEIGVFFPSAGGRDGSSGGIMVGYGYYWISASYDASNAFFLYFDSSMILPLSGTRRPFGFSVRPVKE